MAPHVAAYPFGEVVALTGCTRRQLAHWVALGIVTPYVREATGTGTQRLFGPGNLIEVRVAKLLADFRITAETIRWVVGEPLHDALTERHRYLQIDHDKAYSTHGVSVRQDDGSTVVVGVELAGEAMIAIDLVAVWQGLQAKGVVALPE